MLNLKKILMMENKPLKIIISGGGTGGHIFPALSIAQALQRRYTNCNILFVGAHKRMEMEKVPEAGFNIIGLPVVGFQRRLSVQNLSFFPKLFISLFKCRTIINTFKPDIVVGVGGYASGPLLKTAQKMGYPTIIQEQNSYAGVTNKLLAAKAAKICVAYSDMERYFPANKIVLTGNPVRNDVKNLNGKYSEAVNYFNLKSGYKTVLVVGGSLGALTVNESITLGLEDIVRKKIQLIWQTGKSYYEQAKTEVASYNAHLVQVHKFISRMDLAYSAADIIISRAGAGTISELCIVAKPVILVPSPNVAEDHQTKNANALVVKGAAVMVKDKDARNSLINELLNILNNDNKQVELGTNIGKLAKPDADIEIVNEIEKILKLNEAL